MYTTAHTIACWLAMTAADETSVSATEYVSRGMQQFRENKIDASIRQFDLAARRNPRIEPRLWQRGISLYYAGEFAKAARQFESHKSVNPHDVENAAWHFVCAARQNDIESARKSLIKIDTARDTRMPMAEIYAFYAGHGTEKAVLEAARKAGTQRANVYAHLYLGLYGEVAGETDAAKAHMLEAAAAQLENHYMHDVAKVHVRQRKWNHERQAPAKRQAPKERHP